MYFNEIHHQGFCALVSHRQPLPLLADDTRVIISTGILKLRSCDSCPKALYHREKLTAGTQHTEMLVW